MSKVREVWAALAYSRLCIAGSVSVFSNEPRWLLNNESALAKPPPVLFSGAPVRGRRRRIFLIPDLVLHFAKSRRFHKFGRCLAGMQTTPETEINRLRQNALRIVRAGLHAFACIRVSRTLVSRIVSR